MNLGLFPKSWALDYRCQTRLKRAWVSECLIIMIIRCMGCFLCITRQVNLDLVDLQVQKLLDFSASQRESMTFFFSWIVLIDSELSLGFESYSTGPFRTFVWIDKLRTERACTESSGKHGLMISWQCSNIDLNFLSHQRWKIRSTDQENQGWGLRSEAGRILSRCPE